MLAINVEREVIGRGESLSLLASINACERFFIAGLDRFKGDKSGALASIGREVENHTKTKTTGTASRVYSRLHNSSKVGS